VLAGTLTTSAIIKHYAASGQPLSTQGGSGATPFSSEFERL
jgi:hypothetical protein